MGESWAAQWAAQWAAEAQRFNPYHAKAGSSTGGQFASSSGGSGGGKAAGHAPAGHAPTTGHVASAATVARQAHLRALAKKDRAEAHKLEAQLRLLEKQHAAAVKVSHQAAATAKAASTAAHKATAAAKAAAATAKHHAAAKAAAKHAAVTHHHAAKAHTHHQSLVQRIAGLHQRITTLLAQAKHLDAEAAKL